MHRSANYIGLNIMIGTASFMNETMVNIVLW